MTDAPLSATPASDAATMHATQVRRGVLAFALALAMITYIDRVCISQALGGVCWLFLDSHTQLDLASGRYQAVQPPSTNSEVPVT